MQLKMRYIIVVLGLLCSGILVNSEPIGGLRLRVSKSGLNKAVDYLLKHNLVPFLEDYDAGELSLNLLYGVSVFANTIRFVSLEGEYAAVNLKGSNVIEFVAGFKMLKLSANVTFVYSSQPNDYGPDTLLSFLDSKFEVSFSLGTSDKPTSAELLECKTNIGDISAEGPLADDIQGFLDFGGAKLPEVLEKFCPYLKNESDNYLQNILDLQKNVAVTLPNGKQNLIFQTTSVGTDEHLVHVITAVTFEGSKQNTTSYGSGDVIFPEGDQSMDNKDLDVSMNLFLLNQLLHKSVDTLAVLQTTLEKKNEFPDDIDTELTLVSDYTEVTNQGVCLDGSANISFLQHADRTVLFKSSFTGVVPVTLSASEQELRAIPDTNRTQVIFRITQQNSNGLSDAQVKRLQWNILSAYKDKIDSQLQEYPVDVHLPNTDLYGFKHTLLQTSENLLSVSADLRVGHARPDFHPTIRYHEKYSGTKLEVVFLDGETRASETELTTGASHLTTKLRIPIMIIVLLRILV